MPQIVSTGGHRNWSMTRDTDGHREYRIVFRVQVEEPGRDGPHTALYFTPGLPVPGDPWLHNNDLDLWAHCKKDVSVREVESRPGGPVGFFDLEYRFSTRPDGICQDTEIEDPLLEPPKISGGSIKYTNEATHDRFGRPLLTSSFELLRGPQVEFDANRDQVRISHVVAILQWALCTSMRDTVNIYPLWGFPRRCIKLSDFTWDVLYRGKCLVYYRRNYVFDISYKINPFTGAIESGFDRDLLDEGTKALNGRFKANKEWELINIDGDPPNPNNPLHFKRYKDPAGENTRVILNGAGLPAGVIVAGRPWLISWKNSNLGNLTSNTTYWIPLLTDPDPANIPSWDKFKTYKKGELAFWVDPVFTVNDGIYLAIDSSLTDEPPYVPARWLKLPNDTSDEGSWSASTTYAIGDYVIDPPTTAGNLHIEKYTESDFLLLGIPSVIGP